LERSLPLLRYPLEPVPRVAVFGERFRETRSVAVIPALDWTALERCRPEALAARVGVLRETASAIRQDILRLDVTHAVIAFTRSAEELSEGDRELFWSTFQVPVFEQRLDEAGRLIAWECEAHSDLHIEPDAMIQGIRRRCACGRTTPVLALHEDAVPAEQSTPAL
jgi:hypothetical protein